jgi:hypothetical protein
MGLFKVNLDTEEPIVEMIENENFYQLSKSKCGRIVAATGRSKHISLYEANTLMPLCFLPFYNIFHLRMNSE